MQLAFWPSTSQNAIVVQTIDGLTVVVSLMVHLEQVGSGGVMVEVTAAGVAANTVEVEVLVMVPTGTKVVMVVIVEGLKGHGKMMRM